MRARPDGPRAMLSVFDATMITVGIVIGVGIFQTPSLVAGMTGSPTLMMLAWVLGGLLSLVGALNYAELAAAYPGTGGDYGFLTRAYGRNVSFLFAWARAMVIATGSIALIGFILGDYLTRMLSLGPYSPAVYAALAVLLLTAINLAGLRGSSRMQNLLTLLEVGGVVAIAIAGWMLGMQTGSAMPSAAAVTVSGGLGTFGAAMVFVLLTYGGWNDAAYLSAEVRGGPRAVIRMLMYSIALITAVYLLFVAGVSHGLGFDAFRSSEAVGMDVLQRLLGPAAAQILGALVAISALTSMNSTMIVGGRLNCSLAADWPMLAPLGRWSDAGNTPVAGLLLQAAIALALIGFGALQKDGFSALVEFTAPVFWLFFMLSGIALLVLRRRDPERPRPFRVPLHPLLPLLFVLTCGWLLYSSIRYAQSRQAGYIALLVMCSGVVALLVLRWLQRRTGLAGPVQASAGNPG